ncbi:MAG TPA: hypothetical protein DD381_10865 [Lentisphaeria bacterium]|nr:MAG: hypothetical protein A2X47_00735 [Lentisphaerae bacterium GWF2_38_69]HBM16828.1 hypothetical protein [Lentisphaeria bacterium]
MTLGFTITEWFSGWSCIILLFTGAIIWWYTNETKKLRFESQKQAEVSNKQFELSKFQMVKTFRNGFIDVEIFPDDYEKMLLAFILGSDALCCNPASPVIKSGALDGSQN